LAARADTDSYGDKSVIGGRRSGRNWELDGGRQRTSRADRRMENWFTGVVYERRSVFDDRAGQYDSRPVGPMNWNMPDGAGATAPGNAS